MCHGRLYQLKLAAGPRKNARQWIEEDRRFWEKSLDRLSDYLKQQQMVEKKHEHK
jgi:hypothetical protein